MSGIFLLDAEIIERLELSLKMLISWEYGSNYFGETCEDMLKPTVITLNCQVCVLVLNDRNIILGCTKMYQ